MQRLLSRVPEIPGMPTTFVFTLIHLKICRFFSVSFICRLVLAALSSLRKRAESFPTETGEHCHRLSWEDVLSLTAFSTCTWEYRRGSPRPYLVDSVFTPLLKTFWTDCNGASLQLSGSPTTPVELLFLLGSYTSCSSNHLSATSPLLSVNSPSRH